MTARRVLGDEDIPDQPALDRGRDQVEAFGEKQSRATPTDVTMQLDRGGHPGRAFGEHGPPRLIAVGRALGSLSGGSVDVLGQRGPGDLDQRGERRRVGDRDVGEVLAVHLDTGGLEALDQPVVGDVVGTRGRIDPRDPQLAELALAGAAVTVRVFSECSCCSLALR